ncbi:hypothetical protein DITRI_Ditri16bG0022500 [Diplodiscus trichospermus]
MAGSSSNNQDIVDLEEEIVEDDFCLLQYKFAKLSSKSKPTKHMNMKKEVRLEDVVMDNVLHFLPAKSLCRFRAVSRRWDQWIKGPFFAHRQTTYFRNISGLFYQVPGLDPSFISFNRDAYGMPDPSLRFLPEPVNIRTSCNGLLCCQSVRDNVYYICNPVTQEWRMLPKPNLYHGAEAAIVLVFEPKLLNFNESYELVCAVMIPDLPVVYFEIYSSRSSSWRMCDTICCELGGSELHKGGYYMGGVVYWESSSGAILAFDLRNEQGGILQLPPTARGHYGSLTMIHGELCYILPCRQADHCTIYIHGNMDMSLKSVINLTCDDAGSIFSPCRALPSINDDILILAFGRKLISYHVNEQKVELICPWSGGECNSYIPYVNSLPSARHPLVGNRA